MIVFQYLIVALILSVFFYELCVLINKVTNANVPQKNLYLATAIILIVCNIVIFVEKVHFSFILFTIFIIIFIALYSLFSSKRKLAILAIYGLSICFVTSTFGIISVASAIFLHIPYASLIHDDNLYIISLLFTLLCILLFLLISNALIVHRIKTLYLFYSWQYKIICYYSFAIILYTQYLIYTYTTASSVGSSYSIRISNQISSLLTFAVINLFTLLFSYFIGAQSKQIEQEKKLSVSQTQLHSQLEHYQSFTKYTESMRIFRHDYKKMMGTVNVLLENNQIEEAKALIRQINDKMGSASVAYHRYSNNLLLDAICHDTYNRLSAIQATFEANLFIPKEYKMDEIALCQVSMNIIDNAIEALVQLEEPHLRWLHASTTITDNWITFKISNPYRGILRINSEGFPVTTKYDSLNHGIGMNSIKNAVESLNGIINIDANNDTHIFTITLNLPNKKS